MIENTTETMLRKESKEETTEILEFLGKLNFTEKKEFLVFVQGCRFAKGFSKSTEQIA